MKRALALALTALLLTGCSEEPEPKPKFSPTSEAQSPSSTPSETPDAAPETAKDLVLAFIDARNDFVHSGDPTEFKKYVHRSCKVCTEYIDNVTATYQAGGSLVGQDWTATSFTVADPPGRSPGVVPYRVAIDATAGTLVASEGAVPVKASAERPIYEFVVRNHGGVWLMDTYSPLAQ